MTTYPKRKTFLKVASLSCYLNMPAQEYTFVLFLPLAWYNLPFHINMKWSKMRGILLSFFFPLSASAILIAMKWLSWLLFINVAGEKEKRHLWWNYYLNLCEKYKWPRGNTSLSLVNKLPFLSKAHKISFSCYLALLEPYRPYICSVNSRNWPISAFAWIYWFR